MARKIAYWVSTSLAAISLLLALGYLTGSEQVVAGFNKAGYPAQLRIVLGLAKPAAAIVLLLPGLALLKEWAYAGVTFAWVMAFITHYTGGDGPTVVEHAAGAPRAAGRLLPDQASEPPVVRGARAGRLNAGRTLSRPVRSDAVAHPRPDLRGEPLVRAALATSQATGFDGFCRRRLGIPLSDDG